MHIFSAYFRTVKQQLQDERGKIFVAISAGWFLSIGIRMAYPVLLPSLRDYYDLSLTMAGFLLTILWLSYAVGQIPGGVLADRFGEGPTLAASMAIAAATLALIVIANTPIILFVGTSALGLAIALFGVVRLTAIADVYPKHVGTAHGFLGAVGDIGNTILPPLVGFVVVTTVWQFGLGFLIPLFVFVAIALWVLVPKRTSKENVTSSVLTVQKVQDVFSELQHRSFVVGTTIMIFVLAISQAFVGFYPTYLIEIKEMSAGFSNGLFALFFALGIFVRPISGNAYDRIGVQWSLLGITGLSTVGFVVLPLVDGFIPLVIVTIIIAFKAGQGTIVLAYMTILLSEENKNTGLGIIRTIFFIFGAASPVLFGAIADQGYFDEAFFLLAGLSIITFIVILFLPSIK